MIRDQIPAWPGKQALAVGTGAVFRLLFAGWEPEIGGRPADVVDISLKIRLLCQKLGFLYDGFMASDLHDPALMERKGAETAAAEASPVADQTEFHLGKSRNPARFVVNRMPGPHIRKIVHVVHFLDRQRLRRRILNHI